MLRIVPLSADDYIRDVLPHSAAMWAGSRDYDRYVADFQTLADSGFGKRRFRTLGLSIDGELVSSCKRYARDLRCGGRSFRAAGIGAVFTPDDLRGRGYATALLGALLDSERSGGTDFVYLFSDIHPQFYERLGFITLPSRALALRADTLPHQRIAMRTLGDDDWSAIERCFAALDATRTYGLVRPPLVWEFLRMRARSPEDDGAPIRLGVMRGRRLAAYVFGRRFPAVDSFALDECAYVDDDAADLIAPLIRNAAGDLRKITGWLPPAPARSAIPRGAIRKRTKAIAMVLTALVSGAGGLESIERRNRNAQRRHLLERRPRLTRHHDAKATRHPELVEGPPRCSLWFDKLTMTGRCRRRADKAETPHASANTATIADPMMPK